MVTTATPDRDDRLCAECDARLVSSQTKLWLAGRACCEGCSHGQAEASRWREVVPTGWGERDIGGVSGNATRLRRITHAWDIFFSPAN